MLLEGHGFYFDPRSSLPSSRWFHLQFPDVPFNVFSNSFFSEAWVGYAVVREGAGPTGGSRGVRASSVSPRGCSQFGGGGGSLTMVSTAIRLSDARGNTFVLSQWSHDTR